MKIISFIENEQLVKKFSNTWTYGVLGANRLLALMAHQAKPLSFMMNPHRPARMIT